MAERKSTFKCFHYAPIKTLDTYLFFGAALATLVKELTDSCSSKEQKKEEFSYLWEYVQEKWKDESHEKQERIFELLCSKQLFPYSYLEDESVLKETELPDLAQWNAGYILKKPYTQLECDTAKHIFDELNCKDINEYLDVYLSTGMLKFAIKRFFATCGCLINQCLHLNCRYLSHRMCVSILAIIWT